MIQEKLFEIIVFILTQMKSSKKFDEIDFNELLNMGYTTDDINMVISLVYPQINAEPENRVLNENDNKSFRVLNGTERSVVSNEAIGYMMKLKEEGVINYDCYEKIIENVMLNTNSEISRDGIRDLISNYATYLFAAEVPSDKIFIKIKDTVN